MSDKLLNSYKYIFWDFDGVIKESVNIKNEAFKKLFADQSKSIIKRISYHHLANGGMSRFEKIPIYIDWSDKEKNDLLISKYLLKFSNLVIQDVIDSEWVKGVKKFIDIHHKKMFFFLITGTPQKEIEIILKNLGIKDCFREIIGSPTKKDNAVKRILLKKNINLKNAIFIGDSLEDYNAAKSNDIQFILRTHRWNDNLSKSLKCHKIKNFV